MEHILPNPLHVIIVLSAVIFARHLWIGLFHPLDTPHGAFWGSWGSTDAMASRMDLLGIQLIAAVFHSFLTLLAVGALGGIIHWAGGDWADIDLL